MVRTLLNKLFWGGFRHLLSDRQYARWRYRHEVGRPLRLSDPKAFTEKIQYLKLHDRSEIRRRAADRIEVRDYVAETIGSRHLIPLHWSGEELTRDVWESLPEQFVLKANHGCGMVELVESKTDGSFENLRNLTEKWRKFNYARFGREWVYKDLPRIVLAEEMLLNRYDDIPRDYKFFCFHGQVEMIQVDFGRFEHQRRNLYTPDFERLDVSNLCPQTEKKIDPPAALQKMIELAETLSKPFNFIRVDLYDVAGQIYFGELTNFPGNGFSPYEPDLFDFELGEKLVLE
ncbi:MAG: hypothetical protein JJU46_02435 [Balneolaceae bacterium]|nr:hypothetical protein [Balneolaceae bacterium]MCH8548927.1 hypothetical protein [Balneolaceae bacterium]